MRRRIKAGRPVHLKYKQPQWRPVTDIVLAALTFAHVLFGMGWLGGALLTTFGVGPSLQKMTQTASLEFNARVLPNMVRFTRAAAGLTLLFGLALLGYVYSQDNSYFSSTAGMAASAGIIVAIISAAIGFSMVIPSFMKIGKLAASALDGGQPPPGQEMMTLAKRARTWSMIVLILLLVTLAAMVTAGVS